MSRTFTEARLYGWSPGEYSQNVRDADYVFDPGDIEFVGLTQRAGDLKDTAEVEIYNPDGLYTGADADNILDHGDRVEFQTRRETPLRDYGTGVYGNDVYAPTLERRWTGVVRNYNVSSDGRNIYTLDFNAEDFPYAIMSFRRVSNAWENEQILTGPGDGQGIINSILTDECPELDLSQLPSYPKRTDITLADKNVLEAVIELVNRLDLIMYAKGTTLYMEQSSEISTEFEVKPGDYTLFDYSANDDSVFNRIRVEGGSSHESDPNDQQTTQDAWQTVTKDSRLTTQLNSRKGEIERVEIWTDPRRTGSEEDHVIRLQKDDGGAPVQVDNQRSDIVSKKLSSEFISRDGFTSFIMPEHNLPDPNPWLIVESGGDIGQDIGIRSSDGALAYISHYPYNIRTRVDDRDSQEEFRLREDTLSDESINSLTAARDEGDAYLNRHDQPRVELDFDDVDSDRMHDLEPGDVVRLDFTSVEANGRFVVVEKSASWQGATETTNITVRDVASL